jgi:hypothetical protein
MNTNFRRYIQAGTLLAALTVTTAGPFQTGTAEAATTHAAVSSPDCFIGCGGPVIKATWTLDNPPHQLPHPKEPGTITVRGYGFPSGASIMVYLQTAGGQYPIPVTASKTRWICGGKFGCVPIFGGTFTVTQPDVPCGPNPLNLPGGDTDVYAQDQQNEAIDPATSLATSCPNLGIFFTH